jgi:putative endonuclease
MLLENSYFVYIITNRNNHVLYTGVTNNLGRRISEHKGHLFKGFSSKYNLEELVYYEQFNDPESAIFREKQIKAGSRRKKIELIDGVNPEWKDLSEIL